MLINYCEIMYQVHKISFWKFGNYNKRQYGTLVNLSKIIFKCTIFTKIKFTEALLLFSIAFSTFLGKVTLLT